MAQDKQLAWNLYYSYENFKEKSLTNRRFKHSDIVQLIEQLKNKKIFGVDKAGKSAEGRDIYLISLGTGKKKIFLWSQMHGDEPTATAALFDMFNFFSNENEFVDFKKFLLSNLTIYFMPMVNPDGAELFQRRNIYDIDLNRDAVKGQTPEARVLKGVFDTLKAEFGFNLHDQSREYSAGVSFKPASISFLAPSADYSKSVNTVRENAMKLIGDMFNILSEFIPGHIAKYSDDFEPRAFGDNFTKWGTSVVLVESGGWREDREKQFLRKINYLALLSAFNSIASGSYQHQTTEVYESIPQNEELMKDIILRNLKMKSGEIEFFLDIGINYEEKNINGAKDFYLEAEIDDIGDLSVFSGYEEIDLYGFTVEPGRTSPTIIESVQQLKEINPIELFGQGFTNVILNDSSQINEFSEFPFNIVINDTVKISEEVKVEGNANLIIRNNGAVKFAVVNGFLYNLNDIERTKGNGLIFR